jgi:creatinine amidohydrolase/Fe(II)-dependent formamide hydrolase-like protein
VRIRDLNWLQLEQIEAAEPVGAPVLPVLPYGITPGFGAFPGSPTLRLTTFVAVLHDLLDSLHGQGFRLRAAAVSAASFPSG